MLPLAIVALHLVRRVLPGMVDPVSFQIGKKMIGAIAPSLGTALGDQYNPQIVQRVMQSSSQAMTQLALKHVGAQSGAGPAGPPASAAAVPPAAAGPVAPAGGGSLSALGGGRG